MKLNKIFTIFVIIISLAITLLISGCQEVQEIERQNININCATDADCSCGSINEQCIIANSQYDFDEGCEEFCKGTDNNLVINCINNKCMQTFECITDQECPTGRCVNNKCV